MTSFHIFLTAAGAGNTGSQQPMELPSMAGLFFRVVLSLLVILVLTYLVLRIVKKQQEIQQKKQHRDKGWVRVLDYHALGPNRGLYLVEIASRVVVMGVSENQISVITEIDPADENWVSIRDSIEETDEPQQPDWLSNILNGLHGLGIGKRPQAKTFQQELVGKLNSQVQDQLDRTNRLFRRAAKGGSEIDK